MKFSDGKKVKNCAKFPQGVVLNQFQAFSIPGRNCYSKFS